MVRPSAVQTVWGGKENRGRGTFGRGGSSATAHSSRKCPEPTDKVDTMKHFVNCSDSSQKVKIVMFFVKIVTISSKKSPNIESCLGSKPTHAQSQTHLILSLTHIHRVPSPGRYLLASRHLNPSPQISPPYHIQNRRTRLLLHHL